MGEHLAEDNADIVAVGVAHIGSPGAETGSKSAVESDTIGLVRADGEGDVDEGGDVLDEDEARRPGKPFIGRGRLNNMWPCAGLGSLTIISKRGSGSNPISLAYERTKPRTLDIPGNASKSFASSAITCRGVSLSRSAASSKDQRNSSLFAASTGPGSVASNDLAYTTATAESTENEPSTELLSSSITGKFSNSLSLIGETKG
jgi:hypothetical protein